MKKISLILVDDHEIFMAGLKLKLTLYKELIEVINELTDGSQLLDALEKGPLPDVILMDYHLPGKDGISIAQQLKCQDKYKSVRIIILSAYSSQFLNAHNYDLIREAIDTGVEGYLLKDSKVEDIVEAIDKVTNGETFVLGETINIKEINKEMIKDRQRLMRHIRKHNNYGLTEREISVLNFLSRGFSAKTIAGELAISEEAVTNYKDNIKLKLKEKYNLDFKNVVELIVWAIKNKIIKV
jgi:DNA-binding NarL/FixJ family response regulator